MAVNDVKTNNGAVQRVGYNTAVDTFCNKAAGVEVGAGAYTSMATRVWLDYGGDPKSVGVNGWVYFEVHNKQSSGHVVDGKSTSARDYIANTNGYKKRRAVNNTSRNYLRTLAATHATGLRTSTPKAGPGR